jgi:transposase InsO family protein
MLLESQEIRAMPFQETCALAERIAVLKDYDTGVFTVAELARRYDVARETIYVWKRRRDAGDDARWFEGRSHAAHFCPHATPPEVSAAVIAVRERFPHFGPKKIRAWLIAEQPHVTWPACSTMGDILNQAGLVTAVRRERRPIAQGEIAPAGLAPNAEWATDFKGWFRIGNGRRCDPLTVTDTASRYLIATRIVAPTTAGVKSAFERVFECYGLPDAIRSDNGSPFGSTGAGGLSRLSVWFLKLGIEPCHIRPGSPQENGRHERMHRTMKAQTAVTPAATMAEQQARFDAFRTHYNRERPHEALDQTPPAAHWQPSFRAMPVRIDEPWYDADHEVRRANHKGCIKWRGEYIFIGEALARETIGITEIEDGRHLVRFCRRDLGVIDRDFRFHRFAPPRPRLHSAVEPERDTRTNGE